MHRHTESSNVSVRHPSPSEDLCRRVNQIYAATIIIRDMEFRIAAIERQLATQLRYSDIPLTCRYCDGVLHVLKRAEISMSYHVKIGLCAICKTRSQ